MWPIFKTKMLIYQSKANLDQSRPQSEFVALPLLWDTRGRSAT